MLKEKFMNLLTVKSIVTIICTIVFAYLSIIGVITADQFMTVFAVIVAFYYGTQYEKKSKETANEVH